MANTVTARDSTNSKLIPAKIALIYALAGILWVLFSDELLTTLIASPATLTKVGILKGWFFVLVTAGMLYVLISRDVTKIRQSEQALQMTQFVVEHAGEAIYWINPDGVLVNVNKEACRYLGYSRQELIGMNIAKINSTYADDEWQQVWQEIKANGCVTLESIHVTETGKKIPVEIVANYFEYGGNEYDCAFVRDITERKQAEEALRESQRALSTLMSNLPGMAYRCRNDKNWTMALASEGSLRITGHPASDLIQNKISFCQLIHTDDRERVWDEVQKSLHKKQAYQIKYRITNAAGEERWLWEHGRGVALDEDGVEMLEGYIADITEERLAQEALQLQVKQLACISDIRQIAATPGSTLRGTLERIVARLPLAFRHPEKICARIILDRESYSTADFDEPSSVFRANVVINDKSRGAVEVTYENESNKITEALLDQESNFVDSLAHSIALIVERSEYQQEEQKIQEQLRHADRLATIGQLAAGVAHELNEPLASILGFAQLAKKSPNLPDQTEHDIDKIVTSSLHAREIIKKLMTFARQTPTNISQVDLNRLVRESPLFVESRCAKQGVELHYELEPKLPNIEADATQLHQVVINLIVNALQAMPDGGRLTIMTLTSADYVVLVVQDTGAGMTEEVRKQIFNPFFTTKDVGEGTGLGLAVVHGIISSHRGSIEVESEVDHGSRFEIKIPIVASASTEEEI